MVRGAGDYECQLKETPAMRPDVGADAGLRKEGRTLCFAKEEKGDVRRSPVQGGASGEEARCCGYHRKLRAKGIAQA